MKKMTHLRALAGLAGWGARLTAAALAVSCPSTFAQTFTPGNLVVVQNGDGAQTLGNTGNAVFLDQITTAGTLVNRVAIPTNGPVSLLQVGNSITEGRLSLTPDGHKLVLGGYNVSFSSTNGALTGASATYPRGIATVDANGNYALSATTPSLITGANIRGVCSDGNTNFWAMGSSGGMVYLGTGTPVALTGTVLNSRDLQDIGGNLYYSAGSGSRTINMITGTPTSGQQATNYVIPLGVHFSGTASNASACSPYGFAFDPNMTVCYVADSNNYTNSQTDGGIEKWTNSSSGWQFVYTLQPGPGANVNGAVGVAVSFGATTNIYATLADGTNVIAISDVGPTSAGAVIYTVPFGNESLRSITFAPTNGTTATAPVIGAITPSSASVPLGNSVAFTIVANAGVPTATAAWYFMANNKTNLLSVPAVAAINTTTLIITNAQTTNSGGYYAVLSNSSGSVTSSLASLQVSAKPIISAITPSVVTTNAGENVTFTLSGNFGNPASSNFWYHQVGVASTLIPGANGIALTVTNVNSTSAGGYFAILTNTSGSATSTVATLTVTGDPAILVQPSSVQGLLGGSAQFAVVAAAASPTYQWYFSDTNGNIVAPATGSRISGATTSILTITNLHNSDITNFVVIVTDASGTATSSVASFFTAIGQTAGVLPSTAGMLALWDFDGSQFTNTAANPNSIFNPAPFVGYGTASAVGTVYNPGTSPFAGATDPADIGDPNGGGSFVFTPYGFFQPSPNGSWGSSSYPAVTGTNKANGVQFNLSTLGARNIKVNYDGRTSGTASEYHRLQYTTNGTSWVDYPASSSFDGLSGSGNAGYHPFSYDLTGFPGVDNNPNFGVRLVTEWESTATYQTLTTASDTNDLGANGVIPTNWWVGVANVYTSGASGNVAAGTFTFDLVAVQGDAITNQSAGPALSFYDAPMVVGEAFTNTVDTNTLKINLSAIDPSMAATNLTFTAVTVDTVSAGAFGRTVNPTLSVTNAVGSTNFILTISFPSPITDANDAAPILVRATDTNGNSAATWFLLTVSSINQPPTNSLTALHETNTLVNTSIVTPFLVGSIRNTAANLTYTFTSDNNTLIPVGNIVVTPNGTTPTLTITPAANQVGNAVITVAVNDNDPSEPRSTTATIAVVVRPNTDVVGVDYFNYDSFGFPLALDTVGLGFWQHLSGNNNQMLVGENSAYPTAVTVDSADNTENMQAVLAGAPFNTNTATVLYAGFVVAMDPSKMPTASGSYFMAFNDGRGNAFTGDVEDCLVVATNGAAPGSYRLGISNRGGGTGTNSQMFPLDLTPGVSYFVITSLSVSNGFSTLWVNPTNFASQTVSDHTPPATATNVYNIACFELRESGGPAAGSVTLSNLVVGLSFNSVFYPALANPDNFAVTENSTNVLIPLANDSGWSYSLVNVSPDANGTATVTGTNITFAPNANFIGTAAVDYTIQDNLGNQSTATISVLVTNIPPLANPDTYSVTLNSINDLLSPLVNDAVQTHGGALTLISVTPDSHGTASISGTNLLFTPTSGFNGYALVSYQVTDNIGGTSTGSIAVAVGNAVAPLASAGLMGVNPVITWTNTEFSLLYSTNVGGPYLPVPGATSPYTNFSGTNATGFYRLKLGE